MFLIAYGSLYPWEFRFHALPASPLYIFLHSWDIGRLDRRFLFDVAVNIAIYIPLGMVACLALWRFRPRALAIFGPVLLAAVLSSSIEMIQLFTPHRVCSLLDFVSNTLGAAAGVGAAYAFAEIVELPALGIAFGFGDRAAVALLFGRVLALLFPFFPVVWLGVLRAKALAFLAAPLFSPVNMLLGAAEWLAVSRLLVAAGARSPELWLLGALVFVPAQIGILNRVSGPADVEAILLAVLATALIFRADAGRRADGIVAVILLLCVCARGLEPFRLSGAVQPFSWTPFRGAFSAQWQSSLPILLEKSFRYGAVIWLLHRSGMKLASATALVTVVLAAIEVIQVRIPEHVPEITDPLMAVLLGLVLPVMSRAGSARPLRHQIERVPAAMLRAD